MQCLEIIEREQVNAFTVAPIHYTVMLGLKDFDRYDKSSLLRVIVSTAAVPPDLARQMQERFSPPVMIPFGATELGGAVLNSRVGDTDDVLFNSVGVPLPGVQIKIVDEQHQEVPLGEIGELVCRREGIMPGYYKTPEATTAVVDSAGWYYTGDLATMDEQGLVRIVGRKKDVIIRGGMNIYPLEVENLLLSKPEVQVAAVVGVSSRIAGEKVVAFVSLEPGMQITPKELLAYCRSNVAAYKVPDEIRILERLPVTPNGKVQKFILRDMVATQQA